MGANVQAPVSVYHPHMFRIGQVVLKKTMTGKTAELDLSGLAKGNYVVRISNGRNTITENVIPE